MVTERIIIGNTSAQDKGRLANRRGEASQEHLDGMHHIYACEGKAFIDRQHVATRGAARGRRICGRAPVDYLGVICGAGRCVAAEAKSTGRPDASLSFNSRGIEPDQVAELAKRGRAGAVSVLLWYREFTLGVCGWWHVEGFHAAKKPLPATAFVWLNPMNFDWLPVAMTLDAKEAKR